MRTRLPMWKWQRPDYSFAEFKETMLEILGLNQSDDTDDEELEDKGCKDVLPNLMSNTLIPKETVIQQTQFVWSRFDWSYQQQWLEQIGQESSGNR